MRDGRNGGRRTRAFPLRPRNDRASGQGRRSDCQSSRSRPAIGQRHRPQPASRRVEDHRTGGRAQTQRTDRTLRQGDGGPSRSRAGPQRRTGFTAPSAARFHGGTSLRRTADGAGRDPHQPENACRNAGRGSGETWAGGARNDGRVLPGGRRGETALRADGRAHPRCGDHRAAVSRATRFPCRSARSRFRFRSHPSRSQLRGEPDGRNAQLRSRRARGKGRRLPRGPSGRTFGAQRVQRFQPQDTHIPEAAAVAVPAQYAEPTKAAWHMQRGKDDPPRRPLRLLAKPEPIEDVMALAPDSPPKRFKWRQVRHSIAHAEGPERIAMEWWRHQEQMPTRDYFRVEDEEGRRFWLYREGLYAETREPKWFVHGVFA